MIRKTLRLVEVKAICESEKKDVINEMSENLINRLVDRITTEIAVYGKADAYLVATRLLEIGLTNVKVETDSDNSSYRFYIEESSDEELEIEGIYVIG